MKTHKPILWVCLILLVTPAFQTPADEYYEEEEGGDGAFMGYYQPKQEPTKYEPPKYDPKYEPPKYDPKYEPPKYEPKYEPPKYQPPKYEPPKYEPPKHQPPKYQPPKYPVCKKDYYRTGKKEEYAAQCHQKYDSNIHHTTEHYNPENYLPLSCFHDKYYKKCFSYGHDMGCPDKKISYSNDDHGKSSIYDFVRHYGDQKTLDKSYVNPGKGHKFDYWVGDILALGITLGYESCDKYNFHGGCDNLKDLKVCALPVKKYDYGKYDDGKKYDDYYFDYSQTYKRSEDGGDGHNYIPPKNQHHQDHHKQHNQHQQHKQPVYYPPPKDAYVPYPPKDDYYVPYPPKDDYYYEPKDDYYTPKDEYYDKPNECKAFNGWTVGEIYEQAKKALGGCCYDKDYSRCDIKELGKCIAFINDAFKGGKFLHDIKYNPFTRDYCPKFEEKKDECPKCDDKNRCTADLIVYGKCVYSYEEGGCLKGTVTLKPHKKEIYGSGYGVFWLDNVNYVIYYEINVKDAKDVKDGAIYLSPKKKGDKPVKLETLKFGKDDTAYGYFKYDKEDQVAIIKGEAWVEVNTKSHSPALTGYIYF